MNTNNEIYKIIKDCAYYLNSKKSPNYVKIWALDNHENTSKEQLCRKLEEDKLINIPRRQSTFMDGIYAYKTNKPFYITHPDEKNYGNEYENVYNNSYRDMLEPFKQVSLDCASQRKPYIHIIWILLLSILLSIYFAYMQ